MSDPRVRNSMERPGAGGLPCGDIENPIGSLDCELLTSEDGARSETGFVKENS